MNNIVKISTTEKNHMFGTLYEKKSMMKSMKKLEDQRINHENREITKRIVTQ